MAVGKSFIMMMMLVRVVSFMVRMMVLAKILVKRGVGKGEDGKNALKAEFVRDYH